MYCKNCGKRLPDNARFCDRCNMSVRKKGSKLELIEELKEERLARRKAKAVEERAKKIKKIRRARMKIFALIGFCVLMAGIISGIFVYSNYSKNTNFNRPVETAPQYTEAVSAAPKETEPAENVINGDGYIQTEIDGNPFVYPGDFSRVGDDAVYEDAAGGGIITAGSAATTDSATALMKKHQGKVIKNEAEFRVDGDTYYITGPTGNNIYHRFGRVKDGIEIYYEFTYPADSGKAEEYAGNIEYMDQYLKGI